MELDVAMKEEAANTQCVNPVLARACVYAVCVCVWSAMRVERDGAGRDEGGSNGHTVCARWCGQRCCVGVGSILLITTSCGPVTTACWAPENVHVLLSIPQPTHTRAHTHAPARRPGPLWGLVPPNGAAALPHPAVVAHQRADADSMQRAGSLGLGHEEEVADVLLRMCGGAG